jgi:hypothetical protein
MTISLSAVRERTMKCLKERIRRTVGVALAVLVASSAGVTSSAWAAEPQAGGVAVVKPQTGEPLGAGGSQTQFALAAPKGASCTGSSSKNGYFVTGYLTAEAIDPAHLHFDADGPHSSSPADTTYNLIDANGTPFIGWNTGQPDASGQGALEPTGPLTWQYYDNHYLPPGRYHLGLACTHSPGDGTMQLDRFWDSSVQISADTTDPQGFHWSVLSTADASAAKSSSNGAFTWILVAVLIGAGIVSGGVIVRRSRRSRSKATAVP